MQDYNNNQNNENSTNNQAPTKAQIQREDIQRDIDKQDAKNADQSANIIGQHNYSYASQTPNQKSLVAKLRRKFKPILHKFSEIHYRLEESSRRRKRIIFLSFIGVALIACVWGHFNKPGIMVANTKVGTERTFINADTIKMTDVKYDRHNETMQANFVTGSQSGNISPNALAAHFVLAGSPAKDGVKRPTLNLVPTFNNHFTVIIHHLYPGFGGVAIQFHDKSDITASSLANSDDSQTNRLPDADNNAIQKVANNGANYKQSRRAEKVLRHLRRTNYSNFVIGEVKAKKHDEAYIDPYISPRNLALHDLHAAIRTERNNIRGDKNLMSHEKGLFKQDQAKVRQINRGADTGQKTSELNDTKTQASQTAQAIMNYERHIKNLQHSINLNLARIMRLRNGISYIPKTQAPKPGKLFSNSAH